MFNKKLRNVEPGTKIFGGISKLSSILRDILNDSFNKIIVDDINLYDEIKQYLNTNIPSKEKFYLDIMVRNLFLIDFTLKNKLKAHLEKLFL